MKLYTRGGDSGETSLFGGTRVPKHHPRVTAYGDVDELNAALGVVVVSWGNTELCARLRQIQSELFVVGALLADPIGKPQTPRLPDDAATRLERWIDEASAVTPALTTFILPGGTAVAAELHLARTICRRAERSIVSLAAAEQTDPALIVYMNRLGDLLFAWARLANHQAGVADIPWTPQRT